MTLKILRYINKTLQATKAKKIQAEINVIKKSNKKGTCNEICSMLFDFASLNIKEPLDLRNCDLEQARLNKLKIARACFWNTKLKNSDFTNANLYRADFWKADLSNADFSNADLTNCIFTQANLQNAIFVGANLKNARLEEANLNNADFTNANLQWTHISLNQLMNVKSLENAIMPDGSIFSDEWQREIEKTLTIEYDN